MHRGVNDGLKKSESECVFSEQNVKWDNMFLSWWKYTYFSPNEKSIQFLCNKNVWNFIKVMKWDCEKNIPQHLSTVYIMHTRILQAQIPRPRPSNAIGHTLFALYKWQIHKTVAYTHGTCHSVEVISTIFCFFCFFRWHCQWKQYQVAPLYAISTQRPSKSDRPSLVPFIIRRH